MRYENSLAGWQADEKPLMATTVIVIRKHFRDGSCRLNLNVAGLIREGGGQYTIAPD